MDEIKFFLKFGERKHLEDLQKGNLFFQTHRLFAIMKKNSLSKGKVIGWKEAR